MLNPVPVVVRSVAPDTYRRQINPAENALNGLLQGYETQRLLRLSARIRSDLTDIAKETYTIERRPSFSTGAPAASIVGDSITLSSQATAATRQSAEAINTDSTSFSPTSPAWSGLSSANPNVAGFYDGAQGTDTLTFTATQGGVRGSSAITLEMRDSQANLLDTVAIAAADPVDQSYALSNGLSLQIGAGVVVLGDTFTVDVNDNVNQAPDPDAAFNGSPNFENGVSVTAGSFQVNGETINVAADDSINSVLAAINASAAGVSASYDGATEIISLQQTSPGSAFDIVLGSDTSGFLNATKLDASSTVPGADSETTSPIANLARFAGVSAGNALINGIAVAIDPATDTLNDIVTALDNATADVQVSLDPASRVRFSSGADIVLDSNGTGLFASLGISSGTYAAEAAPTQSLPTQRIDKIVRDTGAVVRGFNRLFATGGDSEVVTGLQAKVDSILAGEFVQRLSEAGVRAGLRVSDFGARYANLSNSGLRYGIRQNLDEALAVYTGSDQGIVNQLLAAIDEAVDAIRSPGLFIDTEV